MFGQFKFRLEKAPSKPRNRDHKNIWTKLEKAIPRTKQEWQKDRRRHDFDPAERIHDTLSRLLERDSDLYKFYSWLDVMSTRLFMGISLKRITSYVNTWALDSYVLGEDEHGIFRQVLETKTMFPCLPPAPLHPSAPSIEPPLPLMQHFLLLEMPERMRHGISTSSKYLQGYHPPPVCWSGADIFCYHWEPVHLAIADQAIDLLVSSGHFLKGEYPRASFRAMHHESGSATTPTGQYQIVVLVIQDSAEPSKVSIGGYMHGDS
ncbi:hypothetical protein V3481_018202 [Fusarium oxysporum f. sp. vasinfectum]|uniref:Uncharacterized protein n=1 Tax=Fusarium oxysporum f. sp. vasinfectum 25433 TaxID=1089449 RepID=X0LKP8_FUSOX|nr:hypothetical protein FOTG_10526 [Fusarium oxysporum f. sp. vasinfectum 25433]